MNCLNGLFVLGIVLAIVAQVLAYRGGARTTERKLSMGAGILAALLLLTAGQIAGARLRDYANFIAGTSKGGLGGL
jgi:hypothetical protein